MDKDIAIKVEHLSKTFRIPHEKVSSVRGAVVNAFKTGGYEEFKALDDVSFEVKKGEFFGIIGRNGSGKSTLLKILAGIYQPDKGKVRVNGMISPFLELGIGFNPELSGRDNVYLNATVLGMTKKQIDEKFDAIVAFSELERFIDQKLKNYSSGMQVRLAFAVSIHANRDILLMDEVLAVGDSNFQAKCLEEFNKYKEIGKTIILVSHDIATVQRYCDRVLLLRNGKKIHVGKSKDVVHEYIKENITDKESSAREEEHNVINKKNQEKSAYIHRVEFLNEKGNERGVFETGQDIVARIYYHTNERIERPVFGVAVYNQEGRHLTGPNTKSSNFTIDFIDGDGFIDFIFSQNPFFSGAYEFTVALFDWECITPFDFKDRNYTFRVISSEENQEGLIRIKHLWKL
jgi:ABC-type polysaccharide/polyol phosphate transport system ATPase subunit